MIITFAERTEDEGNDSIVDFVVKNYFERMKMQAYEILHNWADADDAVQETLIAIALHPSHFKKLNTSNLRAMLRICVRNQAFKIYNKNKKRQEVIISCENVNETLCSELEREAAPEEEIAANEAVKDIVGLIGQLDVLSRDLLMMSLFYHLKNAQTADLLGIDVKKVNTYLPRAKRKLARLIIEDRKRRGGAQK